MGWAMNDSREVKWISNMNHEDKCAFSTIHEKYLNVKIQLHNSMYVNKNPSFTQKRIYLNFFSEGQTVNLCAQK